MTRLIRIATPKDSAGVLQIYAPFCAEDNFVSFEAEAPTELEIARRISDTLEKLPWLVLETDSEVLGYAYAGTHRQRHAYQWSVDVSVYIARRAHGLGIGKALYTALFEILVLQGYYTACAGITLPNPASVALHKSMGFAEVGVYHNIGYKAGAWRDVAWLEKELQPRAIDPSAPTPLDRLHPNGSLDRCFQNGLRHCKVMANDDTA